MRVEFLTPYGALLALAVVVPLYAFGAVSGRAARLRAVLGLPALAAGARVVPLAAVLALGGLVGLAAAQPELERTTTRAVRSDAQAYVVLDVSRSMLARRDLRSATRIGRARTAAERLRAAIPDVPVGVASLTNRVLPHLFPSADADVFRATIERAVGVERPAPGSGFIIAPQQAVSRNATSFASLAVVPREGFFAPSARHKVLVVLTDGESGDLADRRVGRSFRAAGIDAIFVQLWQPREQVFTDGSPEPQYRPSPEARSILEGLAAATDGRVYGENELQAAERRLREDVGRGPTHAETSRDRSSVPLAPWLLAAAFVPLGVLLRRPER